MPRPNPEGWKGGSENFDTVWTLHGHKPESTGLFFDLDDDPGRESGITPNKTPVRRGDSY